MKRRTLLALLLFAAWFLAVPAFAGDFLIVPGQRIGSVALGMSQQVVHGMLHAPQMTRRLHDGMVEESWTTPLSKSQQRRYRDEGLYWKVYFLNVYFRQDRVAQVKVNSPRFKTAAGLATHSAATRFETDYSPFRSSDRTQDGPLLYSTRDQADGFPGYKHYVTIEDAAQGGIAWRYGAWGDLAPDPDPSVQEVIIVHSRGHRVLREPDAGNRFVLTQHDFVALGDD